MIDQIFILAVCFGFLAGIFLIVYVAVEIVATCVEAIAYLVERWKRRKKKGGI